MYHVNHFQASSSAAKYIHYTSPPPSISRLCHLPKLKLCPHWTLTLLFLLLQSLANTLLVSVSMNVPVLGTTCKEDDRIFVPFVPGLFHWTWCPQCSVMSQHVPGFPSFTWLNNTQHFHSCSWHPEERCQKKWKASHTLIFPTRNLSSWLIQGTLTVQVLDPRGLLAHVQSSWLSWGARDRLSCHSCTLMWRDTCFWDTNVTPSREMKRPTRAETTPHT